MIDSRNKRMSMMGLALASLAVLPNPSGAFDAKGERQQLVHLYSGIDAAAAIGPDCFEYLKAPIDGSNLSLVARIEDTHVMRAVIRDDNLVLKSHMDESDIVKRSVICDDA